MRVEVYVEGISDKLAMEELLRPLIEAKRADTVYIQFTEAPPGDRKESVMMRVPRRAVSILRRDLEAIVVAMPDLHPKNKLFPHETPGELATGIKKIFKQELEKVGLDDVRIERRFQVFCFKHDIEALVLACEGALKLRLGIERADPFKIDWTRPVEDQNDVWYPKKVVEELFLRHRQQFDGRVDVPLVLGLEGMGSVVDACPQCFAPFVEFLAGLPAV